MTTKQARWKCPQCGAGILAPTKPRMDDVRRYCLPCSGKTGRLVERIAPALEAKREQAVAKRREKAHHKRQVARRRANTPRVQAHRTYSREGEHGMPLKKECARLWKMLAKMPPTLHGARRAISTVTNSKPPRIQLMERGWRVNSEGELFINSGYAGLAYMGRGLITVKPNVSWGTLAHEIIHMAGYQFHDADFYEALKWLTERRFKTRIDFSTVTRYGYAIDHLIRAQIRDLVIAEFSTDNRATPIPQDVSTNEHEGNTQ